MPEPMTIERAARRLACRLNRLGREMNSVIVPEVTIHPIVRYLDSLTILQRGVEQRHEVQEEPNE